MSRRFLLLPALLFLLLPQVAGLSGCSQATLIPGTKVPDTKQNREIVERVEEYRKAMIEHDAARLLTLAHPNYYEDGGTPSGADDYGYPGLKRVLDTRLAAIRSMRYAIQYRSIAIEGRRATVDLRYDISYQMATDMGDKWERKQSDKRMELEHDGNRWLFLSGY